MLQYVKQEHRNGCIFACLAMLSGKSYREVIRILYPDIWVPEDDLVYCGQMDQYYVPNVVTKDVGNTIACLLEQLGCKVRESKTREIKRLGQRSRNSILIIRWACDERYASEHNPWMCHAVVCDAAQKMILDPGRSCRTPLDSPRLGLLQRQLDSVYFVDNPRAV